MDSSAAPAEPIACRRGLALRATDTLSVAWLRGGFGRDAGASSAGFRDWIDGLDDVFTDAQSSGVSPPRAQALWKKSSLAPVGHCLSGWGMAPKTLS